MHVAWNTLDEPTQLHYVTIIVEEIRFTPKGGITAIFSPEFFKNCLMFRNSDARYVLAVNS